MNKSVHALLWVRKTNQIHVYSTSNIPQVAVIRSKKTFLRNGPLNKGKRQKKTKSDHDMKCNSEINHSDDTLTDNERNELMLAWALSGFQPEGPEAFAPSSGLLVFFFEQNCG